MKFKVTEGSWKGQTGTFVREDAVKVVEGGKEVEKVGAVVLRMAGNRLVEFKPEHVEAVKAEPEAEAEKAAE